MNMTPHVFGNTYRIRICEYNTGIIVTGGRYLVSFQYVDDGDASQWFNPSQLTFNTYDALFMVSVFTPLSFCGQYTYHNH